MESKHVKYISEKRRDRKWKMENGQWKWKMEVQQTLLQKVRERK